MVSLPLGTKPPPQESNISHGPFGEASYFLDDFAGAATVDPCAISVTAVHESSSNWSCTTHCPSGQAQARHKHGCEWRKSLYLSLLFLSPEHLNSNSSLSSADIFLTAALSFL